MHCLKCACTVASLLVSEAGQFKKYFELDQDSMCYNRLYDISMIHLSLQDIKVNDRFLHRSNMLLVIISRNVTN